MGASLQEIRPHFVQLWSLSVIYMLSAIGIVAYRKKKQIMLKQGYKERAKP